MANDVTLIAWTRDGVRHDITRNTYSQCFDAAHDLGAVRARDGGGEWFAAVGGILYGLGYTGEGGGVLEAMPNRARQARPLFKVRPDQRLPARGQRRARTVPPVP